MARWKLNTPHYLKVPGTEWEQTQTSTETGKMVRHRHPVPALLDPRDPADHNYKQDQMIIVCFAGKGEPRDIEFEGEPTPDMEPLDREAEEISASFASKWKHPIETLQSQGLSETLFQDLQKQLTEAIRGAATAVATPTQSLGGVSPDAFALLQQQVAQLMEQNMALQAKLLSPDGPKVERRA